MVRSSAAPEAVASRAPRRSSTPPSLSIVARRPRLRPPQHGLDARDQLARAEGLGHVVVGAELEAEHPVDLLVARRERDHRRLAERPDAPADLEPVDAGQAPRPGPRGRDAAARAP